MIFLSAKETKAEWEAGSQSSPLTKVCFETEETTSPGLLKLKNCKCIKSSSIGYLYFLNQKKLYVVGRYKLGLNGYKNNSIRNNKCDICQTKQHTDILVWKRYCELFWKSRSVQRCPKLTAVKGEVNKSYGKAAWSKTAEDSQLNELLRSHWCLYNSYNSPRLNYEKAFVWNRNMSHFCLFVYLDLN